MDSCKNKQPLENEPMKNDTENVSAVEGATIEKVSIV